MEKRSEETIVEGEDSDDEEEGHNYNVPPKTKSNRNSQTLLILLIKVQPIIINILLQTSKIRFLCFEHNFLRNVLLYTTE